MTVLPIVERELRVATRKRFTYWLRVIAAAVALIIGGGYFLLMTVTPFAGAGFALGGPLFAILTWLCLAATLSAGLFFTSDCLSEEKREGTLGFLFLTDLRGYDVVLGKLFVTSLRCAFALLAVFPILALTLLLGGVAPAQFWKALLALLNAMFFSLATGMFVSSLSRDGQKALAATLVLLAGWIFLGPALDSMIAAIQARPERCVFGLSSPARAFQFADDWRGGFWPALLVNQAVAWLQLALACVLIRRNWQVKDTNASGALLKRRSWWRYGEAKRRRALREKWLSGAPMLWLALRQRGPVAADALLWTSLLVAVVVIVVSELSGVEMWALWDFLSGVVRVAVYLSVASEATRFFAEARRTGLVELLLAAPLHPGEIVLGPWRALVRLFAVPVVLLLAIELTETLVSMNARASAFAGAGLDGVAVTLITAVIGMVVMVANLTALAWFGLWMGMTSRNALLATLKTLVFVQVLPWLVISIVAGLGFAGVMFLMMKASGAGNFMASAAFGVWLPLLYAGLAALLALGKDLFFWRWAKRKLMQDFREQATRVIAPVVVHSAAASPAAPPVIGAKR